MSAIDTYDEVLEQLGRGDPIAAREQLKEKAVRFAQALEDQILVEPERGTTDVEQRDAFLAAVTQSAEELLAAALPLVEYGDSNDHAAIAQALQHVVDRGLSEERGGRIARASAVVAVARVVWALATYALTTRRIDALVALASVGTLRRYEGQPMLPIVDDRSYRYPDALGGNAGESYRDYHDWLGASELVGERLSYLAATLDGTFGETDLLLALRMQVGHPGRTYSDGMRNGVVRRLALRFRDARQRAHLIHFFGVDDGQLDEHVDAAYVQLEYDRNFMAPSLPVRMLGTGQEARSDHD